MFRYNLTFISENIESEQEEEIDVEEHEEATVKQESGSTVDDDDSGDEPSVVV